MFNIFAVKLTEIMQQILFWLTFQYSSIWLHSSYNVLKIILSALHAIPLIIHLLSKVASYQKMVHSLIQLQVLLWSVNKVLWKVN